MEIVQLVNIVLSIIFFMCYAYQFVYLAVPFLKKDPPHKAETLHRYGVLIAARNEEAVIGNLVDSIKAQDYPTELVTVFVVADNCTDSTAATARHAGAVVYERQNKEQVGKGYALNFLLDHIDQDYTLDTFDGFFVFDADNLLKKDYISQMNRTFSDGYDVLTSYRNSKNYGDNWITAGYSLWFLREAEYLNHARMLLGTSCAISGTGFLFSREILRRYGGWNFYLLTEDIEFTIHSVTSGVRIGYCSGAMLFDEQPITFRQSWRQRMRWAKGYLQVFAHYGAKLLRNIFRRGAGNFACFDMLMTIMPALLLAVVCIGLNTVFALTGVYGGSEALVASLLGLGQSYLLLFFIGVVTTITQRGNINTPTWKKVAYTFTFPLFMLTYIPIALCALFQRRVQWLPVEHKVNVTINDLAPSTPAAPVASEERVASNNWAVPRRVLPADRQAISK